jgi:hypothetical protein
VTDAAVLVVVVVVVVILNLEVTICHSFRQIDHVLELDHPVPSALCFLLLDLYFVLPHGVCELQLQPFRLPSLREFSDMKSRFGCNSHTWPCRISIFFASSNSFGTPRLLA